MVVVRDLLLFVVIILKMISWSQPLPAQQGNPGKASEDDLLLNRNKRGVGPINILGLIVSVASTLHGGICTFSDICGPEDQLPAKLEELQRTLNDAESDLLSIQSDVSSIWQETKQSWYIDQILYARHLRDEVLKIYRQVDQDNGYRRLKVQRFIGEVLGEKGNDKSVLQALYHIPRLVIQERLIEQYLETQKRNKQSTHEAIKKTWAFIKRIFNVQSDGFVSVLVAYAIKYRTVRISKRQHSNDLAQCTIIETNYKRLVKKYAGMYRTFDDKDLAECKDHSCDHHKRLMDEIDEDTQAFRHAVSELCHLWSSSNEYYKGNCSALQIEENLLNDRRKPQQDHIFTIIELFQYPALQVEKECSDSWSGHGHGLVFWRGNPNQFWFYGTENDFVARTDLNSRQIYQFRISGHPIDVHVGGHTNDGFRIAVATKERRLLLYKVRPDILRLELVCDKYIRNSRDGDLKSAVVCGDLFGYMTDRGMILLFNKDDCNGREVKKWKLSRKAKRYPYVRCSNNGTKLLVATSLDQGVVSKDSDHYFWGFAAIDLNQTTQNSDLSLTDSVKQQADIVVLNSNLSQWKTQDNNIRLGDISGMALDDNGNFFVSSSAVGSYKFGLTGESVGGIYERTLNNTLRIIREFPRNKYAQLPDLAVGTNGLVYVRQKLWKNWNNEAKETEWGDQCIHKYNPNIDFEHIKLDWTAEE